MTQHKQPVKQAIEVLKHETQLSLNMWKEFKAFAVKGNAIDLAVGVIIGAAFGAVVSSLVNDIVMPPLGSVVGNLDFSNMYFPISAKVPYGLGLADARKLGPVWAYGNFLTVLLNFLIVGLAVFMLVKALNRLKKPEPGKAPTSKDCPFCAMTIPVKAVRCPQCTSQLSPQ